MTTLHAVSLVFLFIPLLFSVHLFLNRGTMVGPVSGNKSWNQGQERLFVNSKKPLKSSQVKVDRGFSLPSVRECSVPPERRFDCGRDRLLSRDECEHRGCCFSPLPHSLGPPWCFYPHMYPGYHLGPFSPADWGKVASLTRATPSYLPKDVSTLSLEVIEQAAVCLHLTIKDPSSQRYEVQIPGSVSQSRVDADDVLYATEYQHDPFGLTVQRKSNGRMIMNTTVAPLLFADQYLQLSTMLASSLVSGLGQHYTTLSLDLNWTSLAFWNRDMAPHGDANLYGSHPFFIVQEEDGFAHGVLLLNSNALEVVLQPTPALTWISTGGILDFYIFLGPDPQSVIRQYLHIIGMIDMQKLHCLRSSRWRRRKL